jgi:hypothetical protein
LKWPKYTYLCTEGKVEVAKVHICALKGKVAVAKVHIFVQRR